jgi:hypothetical protein
MVKEPLLPRSSQAISQGGTQSAARTAAPITAPSGAPSAAPAGSAQSLAIKYVDLPELPETFADSVNSVSFDGQTLRVEFGVTRFDQSSSSQRPTSGRRYPASRIVLTRTAALEMINRLQQVATAITQSGQGKADTPKPASGATERPR